MNVGKVSPPMAELDYQQLLVEWNATQADFPACCVHQLFEAQAAQTPDALALIDDELTLTYAELNQCANQMAYHLLTLGVQLDNLIGICIERSAELFIGLLGILKAGCAYVPLDASYPAERIDFMLRDSGAGVLLTTAAIASQLEATVAALQDCQLVCLDKETGFLGKNPVSDPANAKSVNPESAVAPQNLAYCIYTSGSTGNPKGVLMEHRSLVNMLWWHRQTRAAVQGVRTLQFCAVSFDFSFHEIFSTLCLGGTLVLLPEAVRQNPFALAAFIHEQQIEKLFLPVTALLQLAEAVDESNIPTALGEVITTGELLRITPAVANLFRQTGAMLHNHYGATEFQDATTHTLQGDPATWPTLVPVGRPLHNVQVYILDEAQQPVAMGETGEFCIGGVGVGRGYHNRPELTNEKFVPNPFAEAGRLYRTGDLARHLADGTIEHLGRMDQQVKIRGFRVELGEIEAVLALHPSVRECAVVAHAIGSDQQLVGYVVADAASVPVDLAVALRSHLAKELPEYMLPARFVQLAAMPLTPSGKLDRRALPAPQQARPALSMPLVKPHTATERRLAQIWQATLALDGVGIQDNFFELGGTSLLLTQAHKAVRDTFGLPLAAVALFQYPTIQTLAQHIDRTTAQTAQPAKDVSPIKFEQQTVQKSLSNGTIAANANRRQASLQNQRARRDQHRDQQQTQSNQRAMVVKPIFQQKSHQIELFPSVGEYPVYDAYLYNLMTNDLYRNRAYRAAINSVVKDKTVVDIGTGQDAVLALFAVEGGAKKVYALERSQRAYELAVARIQEIGMADKIEVIYGDATEIELPELVDVCLSEVIGNIGGSEGAAMILNDARKFLKPDGVMIPQRCVTPIAAVTLPEEIRTQPSMGDFAKHYTEKVFDAVGYPFDVRICMDNFSRTHFLSAAAHFEDLDFRQRINPQSSTPLRLTITKTGRLDGFLLWVNLYVIESEMVDSLAYKCNWAPTYFPVFESGIAVVAGDVIEATGHSLLSANQMNPDYKLDGQVLRQNAPPVAFDYCSYYQKPQFKATSFYQRLFDGTS